MKKYASSFGVDAGSLSTISTTKVGVGSAVKLQQKVGGLPVIGGDLVVAMDGDNALEAIVGEVAKGGLTKSKQSISKAKALLLARQYVADKAKVDLSKLSGSVAERAVYNPEIIGAPGANSNREVYVVNIAASNGEVSYKVFVDKGFGTVTLAVNNHMEALSRKVCDTNNQHLAPEAQVCDGQANDYVRTEGQAASGIEDADEVYDNLGKSAQWYASYANVDLTKLVSNPDENGGAALRATTRVCAEELLAQCPEQNAHWDSSTQQMYYGEGFTALDVTGHEVSHGVTAATSNLLYAYQSGAINESLSDIFGELIDQASNPAKRTGDQSWLIGEDIPGGAIRSMSDPGQFDQPDKMTSDNWTSDPDFQDQGGVHYNSGVGNKAAYLIAAGGDFNGYQVRGIGLAKSFKLWWSVENLLSSGADYKNLFQVLPIACKKNVGRQGTYMTADDCAQVEKAIRATEMWKDAASDAPTATPYCESGSVKTSYVQGFDAKPSDWTYAGGADQTNAFGFDNVESGDDSLVLYTYEGEVTSGSATSKAVSVPAGSKLRIDYSTLFGYGTPVDSTTLTLQYNDGSGWKAASGLDNVNGDAWTGHSKGWSSARYDLSSLAGKSVQFRFTVSGTTGDATYNPWAIANVDNFKVYTCG
ncbi:M4 family metallopeptidase [Flindersiella endophytica]